MKLAFIVLALALINGCVKDEAETMTANISDGSGGTGGTEEDTTSSIPTGTDPLAEYAWHLKNTGQTSFATQVGAAGEDINLEEAHALGPRGKNVRIAVSDNGVELGHPDLVSNELTGEHRSYIVEDSNMWHNVNPTPSDGGGHGTSVAGLIAALGWNNIGSRGVAPEAKFAAFRFVVNYPSSTTATSYLARSLDQMDGDFDIFNYSYGSSTCSFDSEVEEEGLALEEGTTNLREGKGAIYVQSAGNEFEFSECTNTWGNTNRTPTLSSPYKIVVGAVNALGVKSSYSTPGSSIWVSAPGGEDGNTNPAMISTDVTGCSYGFSKRYRGLETFNWGLHSLNSSCNYTSIMNGTSSAAPVTSGVVALMLEANPALTWRDVKHILAFTAETIDYNFFDNYLTHPGSYDLPFPDYIYDYKWVTNAAGYNFSNWYGFGRIDAEAAVKMAKTYNVNLGTFEETINPRTESWYYQSATVNLSVPDYDAYGVSNDLNVLHNFVTEAVQVRITTTHPSPGELSVHLVSPSGTESRLLLVNTYLDNTSLDADYLMLTNAFYGEDSYGTWTLRVFDGTVNNTGSLTNWKMNIVGRRKTTGTSTPMPTGAITASATYPSINTAPAATFIPSATYDVIRYEVSAGSTPGATDKSPWESIGNSTSFQIRSLRLSTHRNYYLNVRAIDMNENPSSVTSKSWYVTY